MRNYILTESERGALLDYVAGKMVQPTNQVAVTLHRWRKNKQRFQEDMELLRTADEDRLPKVNYPPLKRMK